MNFKQIFDALSDTVAEPQTKLPEHWNSTTQLKDVAFALLKQNRLLFSFSMPEHI